MSSGSVVSAGVLDSSHATDSIIVTGWVLNRPLEPKKIQFAWEKLVVAWPILVSRLRRNSVVSVNSHLYHVCLSESSRKNNGNITISRRIMCPTILPKALLQWWSRGASMNTMGIQNLRRQSDVPWRRIPFISFCRKSLRQLKTFCARTSRWLASRSPCLTMLRLWAFPHPIYFAMVMELRQSYNLLRIFSMVGLHPSLSPWSTHSNHMQMPLGLLNPLRIGGCSILSRHWFLSRFPFGIGSGSAQSRIVTFSSPRKPLHGSRARQCPIYGKKIATPVTFGLVPVTLYWPSVLRYEGRSVDRLAQRVA